MSLQGMLKKVYFEPRMCRYRHINTLTGTAAIRVGFSTLVSPLLPFFILVD